MAVIDMGKVAMRPFSAMKPKRSGPLELKITPLPVVPGVPPGSHGWAILEVDDDGTDEPLVCGAAPSAVEAAVMGAKALEIETAQRKTGSAFNLVDAVNRLRK